MVLIAITGSGHVPKDGGFTANIMVAQSQVLTAVTRSSDYITSVACSILAISLTLIDSTPRRFHMNSAADQLPTEPPASRISALQSLVSVFR